MTLYKWLQAPGSNAGADSTINWAEGQAPSTINDSGRAMMAATAKYRDDIAGAIVTAGTSTAYTVSSSQVFDTPAHMHGQIIAFTPHATNTGACTLNVDGLGAHPLRANSTADLFAGVILQGTPYVAVYNNTDGAFYLHNFHGNPYNVPLGAGLDYWASVAPNSAFAFPQGQAVSRTTYVGLFAIIGTAYGSGDGSTTFNLPDKRGRVSAMIQQVGMGGPPLSSTYFGGNPTVLGAIGGSQNQTLLTANLPPYTPAGVVASAPRFGGDDPGASLVKQPGTNVGVGGTATGGGLASPLSSNLFIDSTFTGTAQGGTSAPVTTVQPTICCNYIMRIL